MVHFTCFAYRANLNSNCWHSSFHVSPLQGLLIFVSLTQGCARVASLALGYFLSGFQPSSDFSSTSQPFQFEPRHLGCYARFIPSGTVSTRRRRGRCEGAPSPAVPFGARGMLNSFRPASCGRRLPLRAFTSLLDHTRFSHASLPLARAGQDVVQAAFVRLEQLARVLAAVAVALANCLRAELRALLRHFGEVHRDNHRRHADRTTCGAHEVSIGK